MADESRATNQDEKAPAARVVRAWTKDDRLMGRIPWSCRYCGFECPATDWDEQKLHAWSCAARAEAAKAAAKPVRGAGDCWKCWGRGRIDAFRHVESGVCFVCGGTGKARRDARKSFKARLAR